MPDTGAPWNIPFLDGTELVRAYPDFSEDLADAVATGLSAAGNIKQTVQTIKTDQFSQSISSGSVGSDITGLTATITPQSATNILDVTVTLNAAIMEAGVILYRDGSPSTFVGDTDGSRTPVSGGLRALDGDRGVRTVTFRYRVVAGSISSTTFSLRGHNCSSTSRTFFVNRDQDGSNSSRNQVAASSIIVQEYAP